MKPRKLKFSNLKRACNRKNITNLWNWYYVSDNASSNDVSLSSQQVNFEGGQTTTTIELTAIDDSAVESTETLKLRASVGPTNTFPYSSSNTSTISIVDNDSSSTSGSGYNVTSTSSTSSSSGSSGSGYNVTSTSSTSSSVRFKWLWV